MRISSILSAGALSIGIAVTLVDPVAAQGMQGMAPGMMQGGTNQGAMGQGMMGQCMMPGGGSGMMGQQTGRGMMGSGMMGMMGSGMQGGMMQGGMRSGAGALFGSRVTPPMNLSVDDVRGYLDLQIKRINNKRLKVGEVKSGDDAITADVVTVDNSLVQRLKVDRHTGAIEYEN